MGLKWVFLWFDELQSGIISPSKLRIKLMGPHHNRKKDGSNSNSARTSPSKLEDSEFVRNSLLAAKNGDFDDEGLFLILFRINPFLGFHFATFSLCW